MKKILIPLVLLFSSCSSENKNKVIGTITIKPDTTENMKIKFYGSYDGFLWFELIDQKSIQVYTIQKK